jgi:hypothetical protein
VSSSTPPASARQALAMARAGFEYLAAAGPAGLPALLQAVMEPLPPRPLIIGARRRRQRLQHRRQERRALRRQLTPQHPRAARCCCAVLLRARGHCEWPGGYFL